MGIVLALLVLVQASSALTVAPRRAVVGGGWAAAAAAALRPPAARAAPEEQVSASGCRYYVERAGSGSPPTKGQTAVVDYVLKEGHDDKAPVYVDSTKQTAAARPKNFRVGVGELIAAFDEALMTMRVGEKRVVVVPPELGYGKYGIDGLVPPEATLIYTIELRGVL